MWLGPVAARATDYNVTGVVWAKNIGWIHFRAGSLVAYEVQSSRTSSTCWDSTECVGRPCGEATCDGNVNLADLFASKANFGKPAPWTGNECCAYSTHDGSINLADLFVLKAGFSSGPYSPSACNQSCPP